MPTDVIMPNLGLTMETGTVHHWLAAEGQAVEADAALLEVETDKVVVEVEAPALGLLGALLVREGETVPIGTVLARIYGPGEQRTDAETGRRGEPARAGPPPLAVQRLPVTPPGPIAGRGWTGEDLHESIPTGHGAVPDVQGTGRSERVFSSPRARKRAREAGLDWHTVHGTGPMGRVIERDVLKVAATPGPGASPPAAVSLPPRATRTGDIATSHFYLSAEARADALLEMRERLLPEVERRAGVRLTVTDLLVKIAATALGEHPRANASWDTTGRGGRIGLHRQVNVGVAVAIGSGLVAPVLRDADRMGLTQIAAERSRLVEKAHERELSSEDLEGSTFTLTDLGMYRVDVFQALLNPPQSAILAVGRILERPVAIAGQVCVRPTMVVTLSCDNRVLDGVLGAQFLDRVVELIEEPTLLMA
jgi:pyruvate dehydrogenase E2 component (dihydrolipoamide acetyltransferase)